VAHGHLGGRPPAVHLSREQQIGSLLRSGDVSAAHDLSEGGLAQALVEACLLSDRGCQVSLAGDPFVALFSESSARVLVSVPPESDFVSRCTAAGLPWTHLGTVSESDELAIEGLDPLPLPELRTAWEATLPALFG
jgi:phosphoribosylformylglycinamidine synthase subunit PurL